MAPLAVEDRAMSGKKFGAQQPGERRSVTPTMRSEMLRSPILNFLIFIGSSSFDSDRTSDTRSLSPTRVGSLRLRMNDLLMMEEAAPLSTSAQPVLFSIVMLAN